MYYLTLAAQGFGGQDSSGTIATKRGADASGMSYKDYSAQQAQQYQDEIRRKQELENAQIAKIQGENQKAAKDAELESAARFAKSGAREDDLADVTAMGKFLDPKVIRGGVGYSPGNMPDDRPQTQAELFARVNQEDADAKLFREVSGFEAKRDQDAATSLRNERTEDRLGQALDLDKQKFARQEKQDPLQQRYVQKRIEQIDADIAAQQQTAGGRMTMAQARALAYKGLDADSLDADSIQKADATAHLIEMYANTEGSNRAQLLQAIAAGATPSVFADDALQQGGGGDLKSQIEKANQDAGEPANFGKEEQGPAPPPTPNMPLVEGQPDPRAMDDSISFLDLIGANPEMNKKIEENAMKQDQQRLEWQTRHLMSLGVPEDEMPEDIQTFLKTLRDPDAMQGLQAQ
jgi:hypothetical protein